MLVSASCSKVALLTVLSVARQLQGMIADMETQIENMKNHLASLKRPAKEKKEKKKEKPPKPTPPVASTSKPTPKQTKAPPAPKGKKTKKPVTDDDVLTFEQKKDLSDTISKLDGAKLERVIQIIHEGVPEIRDVSLALCPTPLEPVIDILSRVRKRSSSRSTSFQQLY